MFAFCFFRAYSPTPRNAVISAIGKFINYLGCGSCDLLIITCYLLAMKFIEHLSCSHTSLWYWHGLSHVNIFPFFSIYLNGWQIDWTVMGDNGDTIQCPLFLSDWQLSAVKSCCSRSLCCCCPIKVQSFLLLYARRILLVYCLCWLATCELISYIDFLLLWATLYSL